MNVGLRLIALVTAVVLTAAGCAGPFGRSERQIRAEFASSVNLFEGSNVRVAGVTVGRVGKVEVNEGDDTVHVTMVVSRRQKLPQGVRAVIVPEALLGERYIQLDPPYQEGQPEHDYSSVISMERTGVPTDFDEVLDSLNQFLNHLPEDEVARLVTNLASVLDGQGDNLGATLENAEEAIDVLRENDEELVRLATHLSDLNEALNSRNEQLGEFIDDAQTVVSSLSDDRARIDAALAGIARLTRDAADLLVEHRGNLEQDLATVTRVGRTAVRNLDEIDRWLFWSAELYRAAERVVDRDENWLPLLNNFPELSVLIADRLKDRIVGMCLRLEVDCSQVEDQVPERVCFDPVLPCGNTAEPETTVPLADVLKDTFEAVPELEQRLRERGLDPGQAVQDSLPEELPAPPVPGAGDEDAAGGTLPLWIRRAVR